MKNRNKTIIVLLAIGVIIFSVMELVIIPNNTERQNHLNAQLDATTNDLNDILPYKSKYMGNNSNIANLFNHLPLSGSSMEFQLLPSELTVRINFEDTLRQVGKTNLKNISYVLPGYKETIDNFHKAEVQKSLIFNSTSAFALIENLEVIVYHFSDITYKVNRSDVEALYSEFNIILDEIEWKDQVQTPLKDEEYIDKTAKNILIEQ